MLNYLMFHYLDIKLLDTLSQTFDTLFDAALY